MCDQAAEGTQAIVVFPAEIDFTNVEGVYDHVTDVLVSSPAVVVADFSATVFCDTSSLRRLIMLDQQLAHRNGQLRLAVTPGGPVQHLLQLMGIDQVLRVYPSLEEASRG